MSEEICDLKEAITSKSAVCSNIVIGGPKQTDHWTAVRCKTVFTKIAKNYFVIMNNKIKLIIFIIFNPIPYGIFVSAVGF